MNLSNILKIIVLIFFLSVCPAVMANNQIKICLTGRVVENLKSYGQSFENAANLALDQGEKFGKVEIKNYFYNNRPLEPMHAYKKMVSEGCSAIIGFEYLSDLLLAIKEQKNNNIPIFTSYASTTEVDKLPNNVFIFMPSYDSQAKEMLNYLRSRFNKIDDVLLVTEINRDEMLKYKEVYSYVLNKEYIKYDTFDFLENDKEILNKLHTFLKKKKYNYVFLLSGAIASAKIADAMNNQNIIFIGTENFGSSVSPTFFMRLNNKLIQSYFIRNLDFIKPSPALQAFESIYTKKYHEQPTILAAYTYDAMRMILKAFKVVGFIDTHSISQINYNGITGAYINNGKFHRSTNYIILSVNKDGYKYEK